MPDMVTLTYLLYDPDERTLRYCNAGHPPALVIDGDRTRFLEQALSPPVGVTTESTYPEATERLGPEATLLLYTDGLVERRGESIQVGLDRLVAQATAAGGGDLDLLCDRLLATMLDAHHVADDTALLALRPVSLAGGPLALRVPAESRMLVHVRTALRRWLRDAGVETEDANEVLVACGEACANVVQHAYGAAAGELDLRAMLDGTALTVVVRDRGNWRAEADRGGGWGLQLMGAFMDAVDVDRDDTGTVVRLVREVQREEKA
jgi:anti-sigma regulatory factor (Ser/Thr protein kinase)